MLRRIITIDQEKCNGCGACVTACHEGAIGLVNGKAQLMRDDYCDGLGDCLPNCPTNAISFQEKDTLAYDEAAVKENMRKKAETEANADAVAPLACGCPGTAAKSITHNTCSCESNSSNIAPVFAESRLSQWPCQIKLVAPNAAYFHNCDLLIAADCTAYAFNNFHDTFIKDHITLIGCPKLDAIDYSEKLTAIFTQNNIRSITLTRMEVPCCGGMAAAIQTAIAGSGKQIPLRTVTISTDGHILSDIIN